MNVDANKEEGFTKLDPNEFPEGNSEGGSDMIDQNAAMEEQNFKNEFAEPGTENGFSGQPIVQKSALHDNSPLVRGDNEEGAEAKEKPEPTKGMVRRDLQGNIVEDKKPEEKGELSPDALDGPTQAEQDDLKRLNDFFGTEGKSMEELEAFKNGVEQADPKANEQMEAIANKKQLIGYYDQVLHLSPRDMAMEEKRVLGLQAKQDVKSQEFIDTMEAEVAVLEENNMLGTYVDMIKAKVNTAKSNYENEIATYENAQAQTQADKQKSRKDNLFTAANNIFKQDSFYGVKVEQNDIVGAYKEVADNKLIDKIKQDDNLALEIALFIAKKESFKAVSGRASYSEGIKAVFDKGHRAQPNILSKSGNTVKSGNPSDDFIANFIK